MTSLGCDVKRMKENDASEICVGFLIIWCEPFCKVNVSIFAPLKLVLSLMD